MARLYMVRHGRAAAGWDTALDPELDDLGAKQADVVAAQLAERIGEPREVQVVSSPLRRCQETAMPFAALAGFPAHIEPRIAEIPSPVGVAMGERTEWLRRVMNGTWSQVFDTDGDPYREFHRALVHWASSVQHDTVAFSHFVAINACRRGPDTVTRRDVGNAPGSRKYIGLTIMTTLAEFGSVT